MPRAIEILVDLTQLQREIQAFQHIFHKLAAEVAQSEGFQIHSRYKQLQIKNTSGQLQSYLICSTISMLPLVCYDRSSSLETAEKAQVIQYEDLVYAQIRHHNPCTNMEQGDCIPLNSDALDIATQEMPPIKKQATLPTKVADYLQDNCRIGFLRSHSQGVRYVELRTNEIFTALVELYSTLLHSLWHRFRRFSDAFATPANMTAQVFLARNLVSAWFHDCYVTMRSAGMKLSPIAFVENFEHAEIAYSEEYDNFLSTLNAHLRATPIHGTPEDSLYIPILATDIDWNSPNPFRITNYTCDTTLVRGLIGLMKEMKLWNVTTLPANTIGRPFWLFDWHTEGRCCAWFPTDRNYSMEDVSLAYIIGVACTPKLGPRDVDDWQQFENNIVPANIDVFSLERVVDRRFFGAYEVRTIERRTEEIHPSQMPELAIVQTDGAQRGKGMGRVGTSKQSRISQAEPTGDGQGQEAPTMVGSYQFCIIDWTYYNLVVLNKDPHTRSGAMQMLALN